MQRLKALVRYIWSGGLESEETPAAELRQRRLVGTTAFLLLPVAGALIIANTWLFNDVTDNRPIVLAMVFVVLALLLRAFFGWHIAASHGAIAAFWIAPTYLIYDGGLNTSNWAWMFPIVLLAHLLGNTRGALVWSLICMATLLVFSSMSELGLLPRALRPEYHARAVAISGSLIIAMLFLSGLAFRRSQEIAEVKLNEHIERLAEEVETRREAEEAARKAEHSQAVFLATVSHELRTPLNGVIGAGELLKETPLTKDQEEFVDVVTSSGKMLLALINDVLDLSKLEAGKVELELTPITPATVLGVTLAPMIMLGKNNGVVVSYEVDQSVPAVVMGDEIRLRQILLNLVGNALKFTDQGYVKVFADCVPQGDRLRLVVEDTGIGIPEEARATLFQPFTQAESSTTRRFGGTGLGLSIVAQLVDWLNGDITVESEVGKGTTFTLSFPLVLPVQGIAETLDSSGHQESAEEVRQLKVLLTDDNSVNRLVATRMLEKMQHEVHQAKDGLEALTALQEHEFDLVLMDVQMPNMDGLTATEKIRALPGEKGQTPIIALTANAMAADKEALLKVGVDGYLPKPVRKESLHATIMDVLNRP